MSQHPWSLASCHDPWYQQGNVESGPYKTTCQVLMGSDRGDLLPKTIHFLPFSSPAAILGCGLAPLLVQRASLRGQVGFLLHGSPSTLPASHLTLSFLSPWASLPVLKLAQSWENHPPTLLGEGDPRARCRSGRAGAQRVLHSSRVVLGL